MEKISLELTLDELRLIYLALGAASCIKSSDFADLYTRIYTLHGNFSRK